MNQIGESMWFIPGKLIDRDKLKIIVLGETSIPLILPLHSDCSGSISDLPFLLDGESTLTSSTSHDELPQDVLTEDLLSSFEAKCCSHP